jgi:hemoglobin-like flavoprotein
MDTMTIDLVQASWAKVMPIKVMASKLFYDNLFEADPSLKPLFKGDMEQQAAKLVLMINAAVNKLTDLNTLVPVVQQLGQRHETYGVQPAHYATVGAALLKTLGQGLGGEFTDDVEQAWAEVYGVMVGVMSPEVI